jgi:hypothetical protein
LNRGNREYREPVENGYFSQLKSGPTIPDENEILIDQNQVAIQVVATFGPGLIKRVGVEDQDDDCHPHRPASEGTNVRRGGEFWRFRRFGHTEGYWGMSD